MRRLPAIYYMSIGDIMTQNEQQAIIERNLSLLTEIAKETGEALEEVIKIFIKNIQKAIEKLLESELLKDLGAAIGKIIKAFHFEKSIPRPNYAYRPAASRIINKRIEIRKLKKDVRNVTNRNNRVHSANSFDVYIYQRCNR